MFAQGLRDRRRSLLWWSLGVSVYIAVISAVWPSIANTSGLSSIIDQFPQALLDLMGASDFSLATGAGYISAELFGFMIPIFILVLTVGTGAAAIAGSEERGTLDLLLSHPIRRRSVLLQSAALIAVESFVFGAVIVVSLVIANPLANLQIALMNLLGAALGLVALGVLFGWFALAVGAATGSRSLALGMTGAIAVLTYLAGSLAGFVDFLHFAKWLSPFFYATSGSPLEHGYPWWHAAVLALAAVGVLLGGAHRFDRRDLAS